MAKQERPIIKQYKNLLTAFSDPYEGIVAENTELIYHYTDRHGLCGIIDNNEIWLTNTEFVNDSTECKALQKQKNLLDKYISKITNKYVIKAWNQFKSSSYENNNLYIASFSKRPNYLAQYRAYGSFCIGFKAKDLAKIKFFSLFECIYDISTIGEWIIKKSNVPQWNYGNCLDKESEQTKEIAARTLIYAASVKFKDENYKDEKEVRLLSVSNHKQIRKGLLTYNDAFSKYANEPLIYFRDHTELKIPIPYVKFPIHNPGKVSKESEHEATIKKIWIGPMNHQKEAKVALEILLGERGYKDNDLIKGSSIPYRGF